VSIVRWDLKEAAGKTLARRTGIVYEAAVSGKEATISKTRYLHGRYGRRNDFNVFILSYSIVKETKCNNITSPKITKPKPMKGE
jgi:hypothetical protein